jgi:hypothetical protein
MLGSLKEGRKKAFQILELEKMIAGKSSAHRSKKNFCRRLLFRRFSCKKWASQGYLHSR